MSDYMSPEDARQMAEAVQKTRRDPGVQRALSNAAETLALAQSSAQILGKGMVRYHRAIRENAALIANAVEAVAAAREGLNSVWRDNPELGGLIVRMARIQAQLNESRQSAGEGRSPATEAEDKVDPDRLRDELAATFAAEDDFREAAMEVIADAPEMLAEAVPPNELTDIYGPEIDLRYVYKIMALVAAIEAYLQLEQRPAVKALVHDAEWVMALAVTLYSVLIRYVDPKLRNDDGPTD